MVVMKNKEKLIIAIEQINNIANLVKENEYEQFFISHLIPMKYEFERQLSLIEK